MTGVYDEWSQFYIDSSFSNGTQPALLINVPLISQITENLWMGGCRNGLQLPEDFRYVVSLYPWEKYDMGAGQERLEFEMYDSANVPAAETLHSIAAAVNWRTTRGKTLVHCQAGMNRSGLITALTLIHQGLTTDAAIDLIRQKRHPKVLFNKYFIEWLHAEGVRS